MSHHDEYFTTPQGQRLYQQWWMPSGALRASLAVVPGLHEHSGRYEWLAGQLNRHGYALFALDLRGHGRSSGARAWVRRFDEYLDDAEVFVRRLAERRPDEPIILFGHSMGGAVAAALAIERAPPVRGLVLSGPALQIAPNVFPIMRRLAPLASAVAPRLRLFRLGCRFMSRDPAVVEAFRQDPLVFHGRLPVRTGAEIMGMACRLQASAPKLALPLLILHGTSDYAADPNGSRRFIARAGSADKTLRLYDGLYHEVLSEPEREQVVADLVAWLDGHCPAT